MFDDNWGQITISAGFFFCVFVYPEPLVLSVTSVCVCTLVVGVGKVCCGFDTLLHRYQEIDVSESHSHHHYHLLGLLYTN